MDSFRYHQRGVSSDKSEVHKAISGQSKGLYNNSFCKILPDYFSGNESNCAIIHADTVGTKGILAYLYMKETGDLSVWHNLAQDAMVMNIDDMICSGSLGPFLISSTIGRNKNRISGDVIASIIEGNNLFINFLNEHGLEAYSAGGETADVGDLVKTIDTGITVSSVLSKDNVVNIDIRNGDFVVGLSSSGKSSYETEYNSGISCNGLTSARHDLLSEYYKRFDETYDDQIPDDLIYSGKYRLTDTVEINGYGQVSIGKLLTSPTRSFSPILKAILQSSHKEISGIIHNTGGAHTKVSKFMEGVQVIKDNLLPTAPIFELIQETSNTSYQEMFQIFNMGTRMEIYTPSLDLANEIISIANSFDVQADIIGYVKTQESERSPKIIVDHNKGVFEYF